MIKIHVPAGASAREHDLLRTIERALNTAGPVMLPSYTVAQATALAPTTLGCMIYVSNETGGAVPAFSDGTNYRRVTDRAIVS
jgi:hypothetical protein